MVPSSQILTFLNRWYKNNITGNSGAIRTFGWALNSWVSKVVPERGLPKIKKRGILLRSSVSIRGLG
jgi:hypothetical protein